MFVQNLLRSRSRPHLLHRPGAHLPLLAVLSAILIVFAAGCGTDSTPTGVDVIEAPKTTFTGSGESEWTVLASVAVEPGSGAVQLAGGRYRLSIPAGAVSQPAVLTLSEAVDGEFLFELGPVGLELDEPAVLSIDYAGSRFDPEHPSYDFSVPQLWSVDGQNVPVEQIDGVDQQRSKRFVAPISGLSRMQLLGARGGTAGWD